jgi:predicted alpha/beta-hydrolase family hydrolase
LKSPTELAIPLEARGATTALVYPAERAAAALILGHGAGAGQRSSFMVAFGRALSALGVDIVTFNFLYAEQGRRVPDRGPALEACYRRVIAAVLERVDSAGQHLFIGGKSMGGRIATQVAADRDLPVTGLVLLGYPLHPPGRPDQRRDTHLAAIGRPLLFVQGRRDTFGTPEELAPVLSALAATPARPALHVVEGGDHSFKLSRKDPAAQAAVYADVQRTIVDWIAGVSRTSAPSRPRSA